MKNERAKDFLYPLIPFVTLLVASEFASKQGWLPPFLVPAPSQVLGDLFSDSATYRTAFFETFLGSALGLGLSMAIGLVLALILSFSSGVKRMFYPYAIFFQTVPIIAIAPLLVIWLGYGLPTVVASSFIVSVFPVIANSVLGLLSTDPQLLNLFRLIDASPTQTLFQLRVPYALPQILGGFKIAAGLAVIGAIVGEFISGSGLGGLVDTARNQQRVDRVFASVLLAALLGILFFSFISLLNRLLLRHENASVVKTRQSISRS
jgi:NitT/TauT family transport system permease protein